MELKLSLLPRLERKEKPMDKELDDIIKSWLSTEEHLVRETRDKISIRVGNIPKLTSAITKLFIEWLKSKHQPIVSYMPENSYGCVMERVIKELVKDLEDEKL